MIADIPFCLSALFISAFLQFLVSFIFDELSSYSRFAQKRLTFSSVLVLQSFMWNPLSWVMEGAALVAIALSNGGGKPPDWEDFVGIVLLLFVSLSFFPSFSPLLLLRQLLACSRASLADPGLLRPFKTRRTKPD